MVLLVDQTTQTTVHRQVGSVHDDSPFHGLHRAQSPRIRRRTFGAQSTHNTLGVSVNQCESRTTYLASPIHEENCLKPVAAMPIAAMPSGHTWTNAIVECHKVEAKSIHRTSPNTVLSWTLLVERASYDSESRRGFEHCSSQHQPQVESAQTNTIRVITAWNRDYTCCESQTSD